MASFTGVAIDLINHKHEEKKKRNIWEDSPWKHIADLENDDVGGVGEEIIEKFCSMSCINAQINGRETKELGGGAGDGTINSKTVEVKTARLGSDLKSFQHELGEFPWKAEYMLFLDIAPSKIYVTVFPNFSEEFYKESGIKKSKTKCAPYFPSKKITWRKESGAFKLDTTVNINSSNASGRKKYTFVISEEEVDFVKFSEFINSIITP